MYTSHFFHPARLHGFLPFPIPLTTFCCPLSLFPLFVRVYSIFYAKLITFSFFWNCQIDLMPDKRAGSWRGMWPGRDVAVYAKSVFSTQFSVTFTFLFANIRDCFHRKEESWPLNFPSFVCRALFPVRIVGALRSSETILLKFGSAPCEWLAIPTQPNLPSSSSLLFFVVACFLIFLKKAFSERKIALEKFPKKDEGRESSKSRFMINQWRTRLLRPSVK